MAQTKQKGFYVSLGEVQLLKDKTKSSAGAPGFGSPARGKPKSAAVRDKSGSGAEEDPKSGSGNKRKSDEPGFLGGYAADGRKRRRVDDGSGFSIELHALIEDMKGRIAQEDWQKGKFPPKLKPYLSTMAFQAIVSGEYDDRFFAHMPKIFPYNRFTMTKLIKRLVYQPHFDHLMKQQEEKLGELKTVADEGFEKAQEEWERSVKMWRHRMEVKQAQQKEDGDDGEPPPLPPLTQDIDSMDVDVSSGPPQSSSGGAQAAKDAHPPPKRYRMTERIRELIWELVQLSNESVKITNEKNTLENNSEPAQSEQGVRKVLYQKIVAAFPEGWMNSGNISREVSAIKKKLEKEELDE